MICDLVIRPEHRRKAIGSRLVEQVIFAFLNQEMNVYVNYDVDNLEAALFGRLWALTHVWLKRIVNSIALIALKGMHHA